MIPTRAPELRVPVRFRSKDDLEFVDDALRADISALASIGRTLFAACDETATVERLVLHPNGGYFDDHVSIPIGQYLDLPGGTDGEMDIEGLSIDDGFLYVTGSHSLKRNKPSKVDALSELIGLTTDPNRHVVCRIPLQDEGDGVWGPNGRGAAQLLRPRRYGKGHHGILQGLLGELDLLKPFLDLPCKEGGFDIEGLAVRGDMVLLGLRGPVIGKHAVLVRLRMEEAKPGQLKVRRLEKGGPRASLHLLDLDGYGIRDLLFDGDDLLVLVGPVSDTDGIQAVFRWPDALAAPFPDVVPREAFVRELELPIDLDQDHAEGIAHVDLPSGRHLLVAYDSPGSHRLPGDEQLLLDAYRVGDARTEEVAA